MNELSRIDDTALQPHATLQAFSLGSISRQRAMDLLDVGYGELLERLAEAKLKLPHLPAAEIDRMADMMNELLDHSPG